MNKQLSVMGLAARASMVPVLIVAGLTALAVGALTYLANPEHTGGAAGVGAAPLAAAVGYLMVMVMLCLGGCGFINCKHYFLPKWDIIDCFIFFVVHML